ncbi:MAG TPA: carboxypeptidase-like regulatory domain-containing protein [Caulifigura sp.]|nr:carboxypeptidase-like regulatory domain-containing protein [Caulifigura sp.]
MAATMVLVLAGCSRPENIGLVSGLVTLDGSPLEGALVQFEPLAGNSPSGGITDASGKYSLTYNRETKGAEIGEHRVLITTHNGGDPDANPPVPKSPEKLPGKYNKKSELKAKVQAGNNTFDFPLESAGAGTKGKSK